MRTPPHRPSTARLPRTTVLAAVAFLDAFQKVADMATNTRGGEGPSGGRLGGPGLSSEAGTVSQGESARPRAGVLSPAPSRKGLAAGKGSLSSPEARRREWVPASGVSRRLPSLLQAPL